jgi:two-component system catabolic regulation response regulator CreB
MKILLIEDEKNIAENLIYAFQTESFRIHHSLTAQDGLAQLATKDFQLIILDIGLPDMSGFEVCKSIRKTSMIPIFFLTARSDEVDKILGLEIGADDYITKPFSPREITARIKAFFRRQSERDLDMPFSPDQHFEVMQEQYQIRFEGKPLDLRKYEYSILKFLLENPGKVYTRTQIMERIWTNPDMSMERTIDTHIKVIRSKLKIYTQKDFIQTHRGFGYSFETNP